MHRAFAFIFQRNAGWIIGIENGKIGDRYPLIGTNISLLEYVRLINQAAGHDVVPREIPRYLLRRLTIGRVFDEYAVDFITREHYVSEANGMDLSCETLSAVIYETVRWFTDNSRLTTLPALVKYVWERYV